MSEKKAGGGGRGGISPEFKKKNSFVAMSRCCVLGGGSHNHKPRKKCFGESVLKKKHGYQEERLGGEGVKHLFKNPATAMAKERYKSLKATTEKKK